MNIKLRIFSGIVTIILLFVTIVPKQADAGLLSWFKDAIKGPEESKNTASHEDVYMDPGILFALRKTTEKENNKLDMIQGNSLIQFSNPFGADILQNTAYISASNTVVIRELTIPASAYSSTPDQTDDSPFITAMGTTVRDGIIAANFLPFGTKIKIPDVYGDKIFVVEDRMNRRYWHKIDIWFPDRQSALQFGLRTVRIQVLES
ncbi:MAG: hypothetical protein COV29_04365 [Candidatus Yanofskybacteria bacterium CG10_big_fil_rev_8_21_14_0_10_36_16]|uniref:3D domain-containing protein n=1 Tax=Candidatus Yanofskybacteria bacterium CG10_big_fil_rev_8_21_14_0_10_36_16 TaxID=1975096 RepID=A0A2J0Q6E9_9BACT|nr:MAG: hypothetical protein COV29_04365 [Candidatus Yanofskybacteria bacterium CG10_big_fil_rev_8_21_14_0_10_36_16]